MFVYFPLHKEIIILHKSSLLQCSVQMCSDVWTLWGWENRQYLSNPFHWFFLFIACCLCCFLLILAWTMKTESPVMWPTQIGLFTGEKLKACYGSCKLQIRRERVFSATVGFVRETIIRKRLCVHGLSICNLNTELNKSEETCLIHPLFFFIWLLFQIVTIWPQAK